jgi:Do/DeqQ family serine protease
MRNRRYAVTISIAWLVALLIVLAAAAGVAYRYRGLVGSAAAATLEPPKELTTLQQGFIALAERAKPSVVNISIEQKAQPPSGEQSVPPGMEELFRLFRRQFGDQFDFRTEPPSAEPRKSLGSGVIIDPHGYILTSAHVVRDADRVMVTLANAKERKATIVGSDPQTDLAIVKIEPDEPLAAAPLGNSDNDQVGSWVMAIGSPLGLEQTVTVGIISAKNRTFDNPSVKERPLRDMIQTDAVINPGNSGGPLLNLRGEVIGINTMIVSGTGFSIGLGFAIPIDAGTRRVIEALKSGGTPTRGLLGVYVRALDEALASVYGVDQGAYVNDVVAGSPAEQAGIKAEDIIVQLGDTKIGDADELVRAVEQTKPGSRTPVVVVRSGARKTLQVTVGEVPGQTAGATVASATGKLGVTVADITPALRERYRLQRDQGVVVTKVDPNGDGARAGLEPGDVMMKINRAEVASVADYEGVVGRLKAGDAVVIRMGRGSGVFTLTIRSLGE